MSQAKDYREIFRDSLQGEQQEENFTSFPVSHETTPTNQRISEELRAKALSFGLRSLKKSPQDFDKSSSPPKNISITPQRVISPNQKASSALLDYKLRSQSLRSLREVTTGKEHNNQNQTVGLSKKEKMEVESVHYSNQQNHQMISRATLLDIRSQKVRHLQLKEQEKLVEIQESLTNQKVIQEVQREFMSGDPSRLPKHLTKPPKLPSLKESREKLLKGVEPLLALPPRGTAPSRRPGRFGKVTLSFNRRPKSQSLKTESHSTEQNEDLKFSMQESKPVIPPYSKIYGQRTQSAPKQGFKRQIKPQQKLKGTGLESQLQQLLRQKEVLEENSWSHKFNGMNSNDAQIVQREERLLTEQNFKLTELLKKLNQLSSKFLQKFINGKINLSLRESTIRGNQKEKGMISIIQDLQAIVSGNFKRIDTSFCFRRIMEIFRKKNKTSG